MNYYIYKYVSGDTIEYIGETTDLARRIEQHKKDKLKNFKGKIYYFECSNKTAMNSWEYCLINKYHPKYNIALKDNKIDIDINEPEWKLYMDYSINNNKIIDFQKYVISTSIKPIGQKLTSSANNSSSLHTKKFKCYNCGTVFQANEWRYTKTKVAATCPKCYREAYRRV